MRNERRTLSSRASAAALAGALLLTGCAAAAPDPDAAADPSVAAASKPLPLPTATVPDYQLGGAYAPPEGVGIVARDRTANPAEGVYSICYVNGFQTQPGELKSWPSEALLRKDGKVVFDPEWPDEALLDTSSQQSRAAIVAQVQPWIEGCANKGFNAVEFDNLDTYSRSEGALTFTHNLALATELVKVSHSAGLAAGQKNSGGHAAALKRDAGFDFAVAEECAAYDECDLYTKVYGKRVIDIEYPSALTREGLSFAEACTANGNPSWMILRDLGLKGPNSQKHVFETCAASQGVSRKPSP